MRIRWSFIAIAALIALTLYGDRNEVERFQTLICIGIPLFVVFLLDRYILPEFRAIQERQDRILQRLTEIERREEAPR